MATWRGCPIAVRFARFWRKSNSTHPRIKVNLTQNQSWHGYCVFHVTLGHLYGCENMRDTEFGEDWALQCLDNSDTESLFEDQTAADSEPRDDIDYLMLYAD